MANYSPTVNPGDSRNRAWRTESENPHLGDKKKVVHDHKVVRTADGEEVIVAGSGRTITKAYDPATAATETFPLKNPVTDEDLGQEGNVEMALVYEYSLTRHMQVTQDAIDEAAAAEALDPEA